MKPTFDVFAVTLNPALDQTLTIRAFAAGAVNRVADERTVAGGKGINVASALADWGARVGATGFLGRDNETPFRDLFARKNIFDAMIRLDGATRTGIKIADSTREQTTDINFPGLCPAPNDLHILQRTLDETDADCFVLAGSLPPGMSADTYRDLSARLRARGGFVALDTSGEALDYALRAAPDEMPHLVKPNIHELETLLDTTLQTRAEILDAARYYLARGVELIAVSMGEKGALLATRDEAVFAAPPSIEVVSTVGAGDAMVAGLLAARLGGQSLEQSARLATAFSLQALTRLEAGVSVPQIHALTGRVAVENLDLAAVT